MAFVAGGVVARLPGLPRWVRGLVGLGVGGAGFSVAASLAASHWVYDWSPLYRWTWLGRFVPTVPRRIVNVHAGFDESSAALRELYPGVELTVLDFYDPVRNPEPSIARARRAYPIGTGTVSVELDGWPVGDGAADLVMMFLAAHEVRTLAERRRMFAEARRVCAVGGRLVVVEHLRDAANLVAYGPGFLHFHSRAAWLESAAGVGWELVDEGVVTPLVRVFAWEAR